MNARETLWHVAEWLGWQDENLSSGLRTAFDGLRLYDYAQSHQNLPEMADEWDERHRIAALGYDPMSGANHEATTTGADVAAATLLQARTLLDSVAYVAKEGDTAPCLAAIDNIIVRKGKRQ